MTKFSELKVGDKFKLYAGGTEYMKVNPFESDGKTRNATCFNQDYGTQKFVFVRDTQVTVGLNEIVPAVEDEDEEEEENNNANCDCCNRCCGNCGCCCSCSSSDDFYDDNGDGEY